MYKWKNVYVTPVFCLRKGCGVMGSSDSLHVFEVRAWVTLTLMALVIEVQEG